MNVGSVVYYADRSGLYPLNRADTGTVLEIATDGGLLVRWHNGEVDGCECGPAGIAHTQDNCVGEWFSPLDIRPVQITARYGFHIFGRRVYNYARTINGTPYRFTFVLMANGERRHFVKRYNGYCASAIASGLMTLDDALSFACAWTQVHTIIVKA